MVAKVFSIENRKGGVGKTTTAVTLAVAVAKAIEPSGGRVLIIDTDPQGSAAKALDVDTGKSCLSNVLMGEGFKDNVVNVDKSGRGGVARPNLWLLPTDDRLTTVVNKIVQDIGAWEQMSPVLKRGRAAPTVSGVFNEELRPLRNYFDYIFIDCPPSLGSLREAVHRFADYAIVPVRPDYQSVRETVSHTRNINEDRAQGMPIQILAVTPTMVQPNHKLTQAMMEQLKAAYGRILSKPIPLLTAVAQAPALGGLTIFDHEPSSPAAASYQTLVKRVMAV